MTAQRTAWTRRIGRRQRSVNSASSLSEVETTGIVEPMDWTVMNTRVALSARTHTHIHAVALPPVWSKST
jgi:hypothetical protein